MNEAVAPRSAAAPSPFTPIAQYAFLSDCHTGALVAPDGSIDWLCVPRFDGPSVLGALLDREAGFFRLGPFGLTYPTARSYEAGTSTLVTVWHAAGGWAVVRDALVMSAPRGEDTVTPHTRPPADFEADHVLVRTVECLEGTVEIELICEPVIDYGRAAAVWTLAGDGRQVADTTGGEATIRLTTDMELGVESPRVRARHNLSAGEKGFCALSWGERERAPTNVEQADAQLAATTRFWRSWLAGARLPDHRFREVIERSALVIKGLTYTPTGATVAAPTTSLPETPGGERNWDYRLTWMRDATFTLQAQHFLGLDVEADEFMEFVADLEPDDDGALQIMYGIDGGHEVVRLRGRSRLEGRRFRIG